MQETADPAPARRLQQGERAAKIGVNHGLRREDAAVHVRFGGEVNDRVRCAQQIVGDGAVEDRGFDEANP